MMLGLSPWVPLIVSLPQSNISLIPIRDRVLGTAINPEDVAYDEATESIATLSISPSAIPNGSRRIGVRARDELGNWSPATYLDLSVVDLTLVEGQPYDVPQVDHPQSPSCPPWGALSK